MRVLLAMILGFFAGSIPFGLIVGRQYGIDIRTKGSGNIGATNVWRTLGDGPGLITFLLDLSKGAVPVALAIRVATEPMFPMLVGIAAILGHMYSPFVRFKGGRGAATGVGVLLGLTPGIFFIALLLFGVVTRCTRYVSVGSMATACAVPVMMAFTHQPGEYVLATALVAGLIIWRHMPNIERLKKGTESKIGARTR